jgi:hypothetical protein
MGSRHLSLRVDDGLVERLDRMAREQGMNRSALAKTLIEEGLRMAQHPGIVFRPGPAGRRPALAVGPDVWEVMRVFLQLDEKGEPAIERMAQIADISPYQVRKVMRYYAAYKDEIDDWIRDAVEYADRARAEWEREQALLRA